MSDPQFPDLPEGYRFHVHVRTEETPSFTRGKLKPGAEVSIQKKSEWVDYHARRGVPKLFGLTYKKVTYTSWEDVELVKNVLIPLDKVNPTTLAKAGEILKTDFDEYLDVQKHLDYARSFHGSYPPKTIKDTKP